MVDQDMLQVSDIVQYFYCPRKIYFMKTLGLKVPPRKKMEMGKEEHESEHRRLNERKTIYGFKLDEVRDVIHSMKVESQELSLYGQIDTVIILHDGTHIPVDVKYSSYPEIKRNWKKQLVAYSLLLESKIKGRVTKAALYFPLARKRIMINISNEDKKALMKNIEEIQNMIKSEFIPPVTKGRKCAYCEMERFCIE